MQHFNSRPCEEHAAESDPNPLCRQCGIKLRRHQRVAIMWLWLVRRGLIADPVGTGKSLPLDAPVLTPSGFRRMGDLKVGDPLVDPEGKSSEVTGVFPQGHKQTYRITFSDGSTAESSEDHLWQVRSELDPRVGPQWRVMTLREIMESPKSWAVPLIERAPDLDGLTGVLPLDPYVLGALLGDGCLNLVTPQFTSADQGIVDQVVAGLPEGISLRPCRSTRTGAATTYTISRGALGVRGVKNPVTAALGEMGLQVGSADKFVPEQYKLAPAYVRKAVLQGLLDTDGSAIPGGAEFGSCSRRLRDDVVWLARSLGYRVTHNDDGTEHSYWSEKYQERRAAKTRFRASIVPRNGVSLFRLERKRTLQVRDSVPGRQRAQFVKWIRTAEPVRVEEHQCISVSADSKLFVTQDFTVTHNTHVVTGLMALLSETGELGRPRGGGRALVVCEPSAMRQWQREIRRAVPGLITELSEGTQTQRADKYAEPWDVLIIGHQMTLRDQFQLQHLGITTLILDDVDPLRHSETRTAGALKKLGIENNVCSRIVVLNATPLQKKLLELYDTLTQIGGHQEHRLGKRSDFTRRYLVKEPVDYYVTDQRTGRPKKRTKMEIVGHRHIPEFQERIAPMVLRRSLDQIDDVELPTISPENVWLTLHPAQREAYEELQNGVLDLIRGGDRNRVVALSRLLHGQQICEGLAVIGREDGPGASVKFDWVMDRLTGDWSGESEGDAGEKAVVFVQYKDGIRAMAHRLESEGIGYELIWGEERRSKIRDASLERFREDPACRVLMGTSAIEKSLNLQVARHLVNVDQLPNPARMTQLSGRVRRQGSAFRTVYVHNLLTVDTHEERTLQMLEVEAALASAVWDEEDQLFRQLTPLEVMSLIAPQAPGRSRVPRTRAAG